MSLVKTTLATALKNSFESYPANAAASAADIADAYASYASAALFGAFTIPSLAPQKAAFQAALLASFSSMTATAVADAIANGLVAFWTGVVLAGPGTGTTIPPTAPAPATAAAITAVFQSFPATAQAAADSLSTIIHAATLTVTATVVIPPAGPAVVPIS